jgi:hypothetical protein
MSGRSSSTDDFARSAIDFMFFFVANIFLFDRSADETFLT